MPKSAKLAIQPMVFNFAQATATAILSQSNSVNILEEAPLKDTPYMVKGVKYGRPLFRLKRRGGDASPNQMLSGSPNMKKPGR